MARTGRPSSFSQEIASVICERIANGESMRQICRDKGMPSISGVMKWLNCRPEFVEQYARARELQADRFAEEIIEISDDGSNDWMKRELERGNIAELPDHEHIQRSRLRVDARKWLMARMAPKKYGERVTNELVGADGGPIQTEELGNAREVVAERLHELAARSAEKPQDTKH